MGVKDFDVWPFFAGDGSSPRYPVRRRLVKLRSTQSRISLSDQFRSDFFVRISCSMLSSYASPTNGQMDKR